MRLWWKRVVKGARENRRSILTVAVVILFVGLVMYGYTLSVRAAFMRILEDLPVVQLHPPQEGDEGSAELPPLTPDPGGGHQEPAEVEPTPDVPAFAETVIHWDELRLAWPVVGGDILTSFGWNYSETFGDWRYHSGIDITGDPNQVVRAAREGRVVQAGECDWYGNLLVIQHEAGLQTMYGHLGDILVTVGQDVDGEEIIAHLGPVGPAEAGEGEDFLHFEVLVQGEAVDPMTLLR